MKKGHESLAALGHRFLTCDPERGEVRWNGREQPQRGVRRVAGREAGHLRLDGYFVVTLDVKSYLRSRVIWSMCNGDIAPGSQVDHINGLRHDDRLCNLRCVSDSENKRNLPVRRDVSVFGTGIRWSDHGGCFRVQVGLNGRLWTMSADSLDEAQFKRRVMLETVGGFTPDHGLRPAYVPPKASD